MTSIDRADDMTCDAFAGALSAYLEGGLDPSAGAGEGEAVASRARVEAHAARCADCAALLKDLRAISVEAAMLPMLEPSRDLWSGIAARIEAPVVSIANGASLPRAQRRGRWFVPAAAAALMLATAGVTYVATKASLQQPQVAAGPAEPLRDTGSPDAGVDPTSRLSASVIGQARVASQDSLAAIQRVDPPMRPRPSGPERQAPRMLVSRADAVGSSVDSLYGREIARLRTIISQRSGTLDPTTVQVIEQNLGIIDSAIVRSRAALRRDPASGFLNEQLTSALEKKVELLRTVATLPVRTS